MTDGPDLPLAMARMVAALMIGVALLLFVLYLLRRFTGMVLQRAGTLRVIASAYVGVKSHVSLVEVPGALLVLGVTRTEVRLLDKISDPAVLERFYADTKEAVQQPTSFADILNRFKRNPTDAESPHTISPRTISPHTISTDAAEPTQKRTEDHADRPAEAPTDRNVR